MQVLGEMEIRIVQMCCITFQGCCTNFSRWRRENNRTSTNISLETLLPDDNSTFTPITWAYAEECVMSLWLVFETSFLSGIGHSNRTWRNRGNLVTCNSISSFKKIWWILEIWFVVEVAKNISLNIKGWNHEFDYRHEECLTWLGFHLSLDRTDSLRHRSGDKSDWMNTGWCYTPLF